MFWQTKVIYEFGPFQVDPRERRLLRDGEAVPLTPKVFDVLLALVQNSGHILSKDELMRLVWADTAVEEGNVARNISTLRTALDQKSGEPQYIETIPWRGYRFTDRVRQVHDDSVRRSFDSIIVVPFHNLDGDPHLEFLSEGITESLINSLSRLAGLRVLSRNSSFRYRSQDVCATTLGRDLKVQGVIVGRVAKHDEMLSISVELIDARDDTHVWGAQHVRHLAETLMMPAMIAEEITGQLRLNLTIAEQRRLTRRHTGDADAYRLYLLGRYHFNKLTPDGVEKGLEHFRLAIEKDPNYALAYAGMADCLNYSADREEAAKAVGKALELDEELGEAHASLGFSRFLYDWDFAGAESEFQKALALSPNYAEAHHWYAIYLANLGRHDEAFREAEMAVERDPLSLLMNMTAGLNYYLGREYERAVTQLHKVIEMETNFPAAHSVLGCVYVQGQMYLEALAEYDKVLELFKAVPAVGNSVKVLKAQAYARWGKSGEALELLDEVNADFTSPYSVAGVYAALGDEAKAFEALNKAYEQHDMQLVSLKVDPTLDGLRDDQRFVELVSRVGLPG
jgi:DNA-binding winged helix-turn-helix (wHTH) protein/tetratricopeptide (TPR) repeat protein